MDVACNVVTFNCCLSICPPLRFNGAFSRANRLADAFYTSIQHTSVDVICLQELIVEDSRVLSRFIYHKYHTARLNAPWYSNNFRLLSSGLYILSKFEIVEQEGLVFDCESYHVEMFMAKGVQYAKIKLSHHSYVHVFNSHLQAWTNERAENIRTQQMEQVCAFMQRKLVGCDFTSEFVVFAADTNCDVYEHSQLIQRCMSIANLQITMPQQPTFSFDPSRNPLVGLLDDPDEYRVRMRQSSSPAVDYNAFKKDQRMNCPKQLIDVVATHVLQEKQIEVVAVDVVPIQTAVPFIINIDMSTQCELHDVSDHFAMSCKYLFHPLVKTTQIQFTHTRRLQQQTQSTLHPIWAIVAMCLFVGFFFVILLILCLCYYKTVC